MTDEKLVKFNRTGENIPVTFIETAEVTKGVRCDVYRFLEDETRDLGVIYVEPGCKTPLQKVLEGEKTIEGFYMGRGILTIIKINGEKETYEVDDKSGKDFFQEVRVGETMQWEATPDSILIAYEVCYPPYKPGRYEDLVE
ncbi:MAG: hypothetical protein US68_C0001G0050 [Candidatus Shapirobacteria bacterium GW2011_GWE1_38_10]|uniref:Uncharacterized protein n=1 Tax=Candidatus Shapirobacteria bacterium GW2011_GWE1_38_10 TaxID=1618488 RepID=A0A0G0LDW1_9BACT|nr:MAG: hypothetical protein US46_C0004G0032 [Candidatus Shapirobacteria bacterium GW2011_GWF2_37_20]KKQ50851.1 MAG: hypothetical protein US68_C0001G0050 [Candidatus Shapirobacteria bacterium GW2011_GWE1_38_10]HBP51063.1 hypothetical protein [Candidatus Shapirobacteria bacterium]